MMNGIIVLPAEISSKIAAGEVIERPYSVVKELVENSLDAGAGAVTVQLADGGKKLISVKDDGGGMSRADAEISFERHSTSKLRTEADLESIRTLGFRGEALPSISAVSRVTLTTSTGGEDGGTRIRREGERTLDVVDAAHPRGTTVEVRDLFFNLPARRKFLRSDRSELTQITQYITHQALANPSVRFTLNHGERRIFDYPAVKDLRERLYQVYGRSLLERVIEVNCVHEDTSLSGFVSQPPQGRRDRKHQLFFVNGRFVRDKTLQAALNQAFSGHLEKDQSPEAFLFLTVSPAAVDVNVHPAKTEVRFRDPGALFRFVLFCLERALIQAMNVKPVYPESRPSAGPARIAQPGSATGVKPQAGPAESLFPGSGDGFRERDFQVLGQYEKAYIVVSDEGGLLVVDQHNAHERVLYEKYEDIHKQRSWPRKQALMPRIIELSPSQVLVVEDSQALFEQAGFRIEDMGGRSYALKEYPDIFKEEEAVGVFLALLEDMEKGDIEDKRSRLLATLACKTAVKAGEVLSPDKMTYLVESLRDTANPSLCPHGRPVSVRLSRTEIEKGLKRR